MLSRMPTHATMGEENMGKLDGKVAIVTGAGRGLGRAYARRLAGLGAKIAVTDLNLKSYAEFEAEAKEMTADSTVDEINAGGGEAIGIEMDVRDRASVDAMVQKVFDTWGRVDILVANAGGGRGRPIDTKASTLDSDLLHLVTEMNYYGTVYCVNAVAPIMKAQHSGKIVTVASVAALGPLGRRRLRTLRRGEGGDPALHAVSGSGSWPARHQCELHRTGHDHHRAGGRDSDAQSGERQPRSYRAGGVAPPWWGRGLCQGGGIPDYRPVGLCDRAVHCDRWGTGAVRVARAQAGAAGGTMPTSASPPAARSPGGERLDNQICNGDDHHRFSYASFVRPGGGTQFNMSRQSSSNRPEGAQTRVEPAAAPGTPMLCFRPVNHQQKGRSLGPWLPRPPGFGSFGTRACVNADPEEILMAALSRDAHRRRVLEHQAKVAADQSAPVTSSSDPQLKIRLIGEVRRSDETVEPKRARQRSRKRAQPDLGV